jgi:NADPH:quinone reductase-like Zn-dependent oxidoreductase
VLALTRPSKGRHLEKLGTDAVLDRKAVDLTDRLVKALPKGECDVVADVVGGTHFPMLIALLRRGGRYVSSGAIAGPIVELDLRALYLKDLAMHGATVMPVGIFAQLVQYIENREIHPLLAQEFALQDIHKAQTKFLKKDFFGNIILKPPGIS